MIELMKLPLTEMELFLFVKVKDGCQSLFLTCYISEVYKIPMVSLNSCIVDLKFRVEISDGDIHLRDITR